MPGVPADLASRSLQIGQAPLALPGQGPDLAARALVLDRTQLLGGITTRAYGLSSRNLQLEAVASIGWPIQQQVLHNSRSLLLAPTALQGRLWPTVAFPELVPSSMEFLPPQLAVTEHGSYSGERELHIWADQPSAARVALTYENVPDTVAEVICATWERARGATHRLSLSDHVLGGEGLELAAYMEACGPDYGWHFQGPPQWAGTLRGYGTLTVTLESRQLFVSGALAVEGENAGSPAISEDGTSYSECDYVSRVYAGFQGFIDSSTIFRYLRVRDWDGSLFGVGTNAEGPGYTVDGSWTAEAIAPNTGIVIQASGSYAFRLGQTISYATEVAPFGTLVSNTRRQLTGNPLVYVDVYGDVYY